MFQLTISSTPEQEAISNRHQWPVHVLCKNTADNSAAYVFVMRKAPPGAFIGDNFSCVASVQQMQDLPVDDPAEGSPYFRVSSVLTYCRNAEAAEEFVSKVTYAIQDLADNTLAASNLSAVRTVTITPAV